MKILFLDVKELGYEIKNETEKIDLKFNLFYLILY